MTNRHRQTDHATCFQKLMDWLIHRLCLRCQRRSECRLNSWLIAWWRTVYYETNCIMTVLHITNNLTYTAVTPFVCDSWTLVSLDFLSLWHSELSARVPESQNQQELCYCRGTARRVVLVNSCCFTRYGS